MGGYGSGRPRCHGVLEQRLRLDVRTFRRRGWLARRGGGVLRWSQDGEETASLGYQVTDGALTLAYKTTDEHGSPLPISVTIPITTVPCRFGGHRRYWRCPRCWRRCEVLAAGWRGRGWACRQCLRLRHASQGLAPADRIQARAHKLFTRLGGDSDFVMKPKWMRWRTFNRLVDQAHWLDAKADLLFASRCMRRFGMLPSF